MSESSQRWHLWREPDGEWQLGDPFGLPKVPVKIETLEVMPVAEHEQVVVEFSEAWGGLAKAARADAVCARDELERMKLADELRQIMEEA